MFKTLKHQVNQHFNQMSKNTLFQVTVDRDLIWEHYLSGFSDETRQSHNCNCCESFIRQFGSVVTIVNNKMVSIWDIVPKDDEYNYPISNLSKYVHSLPITDVFKTEESNMGTDWNIAHNPPHTRWEHFHVVAPLGCIVSKHSVDTVKAGFRDTKQVFKRSLDEITLDSIETTLDLINQGSLYKGNEFKPMIVEFGKIKLKYDKLPVEEKDLFAWQESVKTPLRIRNTAIGTLLTDLSEGKELDFAVKSFETKVAPTNYKRPTALVTKSMIDSAEKRIEELGLKDSLFRRYAVPTDLTVNNILFADRSSGIQDIFGQLKKDVTVNPRSLSKVEEVSIEDFISKILPTAKSLEVLVENSHLNNLVSLIAPIQQEATAMFKWSNNFSWSYTNGIADSMKEKVKAAGGSVDGVMRFSLKWNEDGTSICDLDLHCIWNKNRNHIYYGSKGSREAGYLDVDMIRPREVGIENIIFKNKPSADTYTFSVNNYDGNRNSGCECQLEVDGTIYDFSYGKHLAGTVPFVEVHYDGVNFTVKPLIDATSNVLVKEKWGVKTNQFQKVKLVNYSPNHWDNNVGHKHYMFILEGCVSDESPRPFFNEFLKPELDKDRKVFEVLGSKIKVEPSTEQLSGLGFSDTVRNHVYVKVKGNFERTLKVNI